jgi:translation initiation factor IF-2
MLQVITCILTDFIQCDLAAELLNIGYHVTGTIQQNRKDLPDTLTKKKLKIKKHEVAAYRKHDKMLAVAWKDKRNAVMLITWHNSMQNMRRNVKNHVEQFRIPVVICDYNKHMGGVDVSD